MKVKDGVDLRTLRGPIRHAAQVADQLHIEYTGNQVTITSATEGRHSVERSAHYRGDAIDVRIWEWKNPRKFADLLQAELGTDYVVLLEETHIHIHWSPVYDDQLDQIE